MDDLDNVTVPVARRYSSRNGSRRLLSDRSSGAANDAKSGAQAKAEHAQPSSQQDDRPTSQGDSRASSSRGMPTHNPAVLYAPSSATSDVHSTASDLYPAAVTASRSHRLSAASQGPNGTPPLPEPLAAPPVTTRQAAGASQSAAGPSASAANSSSRKPPAATEEAGPSKPVRSNGKAGGKGKQRKHEEGDSPLSQDEVSADVELSIAQRAVMERYTSNLRVEFTEDQARQLELAAIEKALQESQQDEAAMWGLDVVEQNGDQRVVLKPEVVEQPVREPPPPVHDTAPRQQPPRQPSSRPPRVPSGGDTQDRHAAWEEQTRYAAGQPQYRYGSEVAQNRYVAVEPPYRYSAGDAHESYVQSPMGNHMVAQDMYAQPVNGEYVPPQAMAAYRAPLQQRTYSRGPAILPVEPADHLSPFTGGYAPPTAEYVPLFAGPGGTRPVGTHAPQAQEYDDEPDTPSSAAVENQPAQVNSKKANGGGGIKKLASKIIRGKPKKDAAVGAAGLAVASRSMNKPGSKKSQQQPVQRSPRRKNSSDDDDTPAEPLNFSNMQAGAHSGVSAINHPVPVDPFALVGSSNQPVGLRDHGGAVGLAPVMSERGSRRPVADYAGVYLRQDGTPVQPLGMQGIRQRMEDGTPTDVLPLDAVQQRMYDEYDGTMLQPLPLSAVRQLPGDEGGLVLADDAVQQWQQQQLHMQHDDGYGVQGGPMEERGSRAPGMGHSDMYGPPYTNEAGSGRHAAAMGEVYEDAGRGGAGGAALPPPPLAAPPGYISGSTIRSAAIAGVSAGAAGPAAEGQAARPGAHARQRTTSTDQELLRAIQESEAEAARRREEEEREFEEQLARALAESEATAKPVGVGRGAPTLHAEYADADENELLRKVLEESAREEDARRRVADDEQLLVAQIMRESLEEAYMPSMMAARSSVVQQQQQEHMDDDEFEQALAASRNTVQPQRQNTAEDPMIQSTLQASVGDEEVAEIVRETRQLRTEFKASLDNIQQALAMQSEKRSKLEAELTEARENQSPNSVALSAKLARTTKDIKELDKRMAPVEQVVKELETMEQFVEQARPGRAEFNVVRDMVLKNLSDELSSVGWGVQLQAGPGQYSMLAARLAQQTLPLLQGEMGVPQDPTVPTDKGKGYDLNSTLQGLQEMRARIEARKQKRLQDLGLSSSNGQRPSNAASTYQKALLNLKQISKPTEEATVATSAAATSRAAQNAIGRRRMADAEGSSSDEEGEQQRVVPPRRERLTNPNLFNPEGLFEAKREWAKNNAQPDSALVQPQHCFEHLLVVGLPPTIDAKYLEAAAASVQKQRPSPADATVRGPRGPALSAEVLYSYPPDKALENANLIADFCFPAGVQPRLLERTPSMSSLNQVIYRQSCNDRDDRSFVFVLAVQTTERMPLYGVCVYVDEFVFVPPPVAGDTYPFIRPALSKHVVAAPRCYCLLSHYPFFTLHFQFLNLMLSLGRLERIKLLEKELSSPAPGLPLNVDDTTNDNSPSSITDGDSAASGLPGLGDSLAVADRVMSGSQASQGPGSLQVASARQVLQQYYGHRVPNPGESVDLQLDATLKPLVYKRVRIPHIPADASMGALVRMSEAEAAMAMRHWTIACLCRTLSLNNVLSLLTAALLERSLALFCPNIGLLSAVVLSLLPMLRPFSWQSLMLPILPLNMMEIVEAPFPFVVGILYKTAEIRSRCSAVTRVNVYKNRIKIANPMPQLPGHSTLVTKLVKPYAMLAAAGKGDEVQHQPVYRVTDAQRSAADAFLEVLGQHLTSFCSNLRAHTITDVQTPERVSMLLKDSFVDSFPAKDRQFFKEFVETQLFTVYSDSLLN